MSARSAVARLSEMNRDELRFRFLSEARKLAGRVRCAIRPPLWDRADLAGILDARQRSSLVATAAAKARRGDYLGAHHALAEHFLTRASAWPLQARKRAELAEGIRQAFPDAVRTAGARADRLVEGRHDLLGYRNVALGNPPDWHLDVVHRRRAPIAHWADVPYLDPASGDHKVIWETNRHQYFLALGSAYWLTADPRYRQIFVAHLEDWLESNRPLRGVNWSSMLELAFRAMSWTWAVEFFSTEAECDETPWLVDLLVALDRQLTHVAHNLSTYFSPNTHITGEALALYAVSQAFPELRRSAARAATGRTILLQETEKQIHADGGHVELSPHYHRYTTDFYLLALMVARASNDAAATVFEQSVRKQAAYLRTIADDEGRLPMLGDDDGGQLFRFAAPADGNAAVTLGVAASLLDDPSLAVTPPTEETAWILARAPRAAPSRMTDWPSRLLPDSGYFVSRMPRGHFVFDAGPHGFLNGGHAHADALAVTLTVAGEPLLVDPGTATYTMDPALRDRLRSPRMHNTLVLDGEASATPRGPFHWHSRADARMLVARIGSDVDFAAGTHDAYGTRRHLRAVVALHDLGWVIVDRVTSDRPTGAEIFWHLHPAWRATVSAATIDLVHASGRTLALATTAHDIAIAQDPGLSSYAPAYGRLETSTTLVARHAAPASFTVGTFIPDCGVRRGRVAIAEIPATAGAPEWHHAAFAVLRGDDEIQISIAFPASPEALPRDDWPQPCITRPAVSRAH